MPANTRTTRITTRTSANLPIRRVQLVGTGTVIAAAATGLVFGQPIESKPPPSSRPSSPFKRKLFNDFRFDNSRSAPIPSPALSRTGTSTAVHPSQLPEEYVDYSVDPSHPSPLHSHPISVASQSSTTRKRPPPPKLQIASRRQSYIHPTDGSTTNNSEASRDSVSSSHNSWMRRLSLRPPSQQDSPRSSLGPDSMVSLAQGPGEAILSPTDSVSASLGPNKLVKKSGGNRESLFARRNSRAQIPTLQRPATSHQRSATAQHFPLSPAVNLRPESPFFFEPFSPRPRASTAGLPSLPWKVNESSGWTSFFHVRRVKTSRRGHKVASSTDNKSMDYPLPGTRIQLRHGSLPRPFLINPQRISGETFVMSNADPDLESIYAPEDSQEAPSEQSSHSERKSGEFEETPTKNTRRSLVTHFKPTSGWGARAGSLRRSKRDSLELNVTRRYLLDPTSPTSSATPLSGTRLPLGDLFTPPKSGHRDLQKMQTSDLHSHDGDCPSPIPPLARLSSFHLDMCRVGPSPPSSAGGPQACSPTHPSPNTASFGAPLPSHRREVSKEGALTLAGSDMSLPGLASGDDDTDYKSDAFFDSFRTSDSRLETPLDTLFHDFPQDPMANTKAERLSIQEITGTSWDEDAQILEEDDDASTPMRGLRHERDDRATEIAKHQLSMGRLAPRRLSLDTTDDDDEWARDDDEVLSHPLSPPTSCLCSRRGQSPQWRSALASISGNGSSDCYTVGASTERPRSNVFDWSEPAVEKSDEDGYFSRPRTAYGKQELDPRGGRLANRRVFFPTHHTRSQSVPVVTDPSECAKANPAKFATWNTGAKKASEEWDDDFDLDEDSNLGPKNTEASIIHKVPSSIRLRQDTVKAHSGQIRELSLLVSNLRRLCRQGRDLDLLGGRAAPLWKEAENIIALASPDEEDAGASDTDSSFEDFDPASMDERFLDEGFDASVLERSDSSGDPREPDISKNAVVRERQIVRRRSVFSPDDDIFGTNMSGRNGTRPHTPRTPDRVREFHTPEGTVVSSAIAAMERQRSQPNRPPKSPLKPSKAKLFFDTNSLQELVKRASAVFHQLSDLVRREELLTMSPQATPRVGGHRRGESPAFTRVFTDPDAGSPRHLVKSQKSHSPLPRRSLESKAMSQRIHMMVN